MGAFAGTAERAGGGRDGVPRRWARCRTDLRLRRLGRGPGGTGSGAEARRWGRGSWGPAGLVRSEAGARGGSEHQAGPPSSS